MVYAIRDTSLVHVLRLIKASAGTCPIQSSVIGMYRIVLKRIMDKTGSQIHIDIANLVGMGSPPKSISRLEYNMVHIFAC